MLLGHRAAQAPLQHLPALTCHERGDHHAGVEHHDRPGETQAQRRHQGHDRGHDSHQRQPDHDGVHHQDVHRQAEDCVEHGHHPEVLGSVRSDTRHNGLRRRLVQPGPGTDNGGMRLFDDTPTEERIGDRDLTAWPTRFGAWLATLALTGARWTSAHALLVVIAVIGGIFATALTGVSAEIYDAVEEGDGVTGLDRPALDTAIRLRTPLADHVATWFTDLGGPVGMTILATVVTVALASPGGRGHRSC